MTAAAFLAGCAETLSKNDTDPMGVGPEAALPPEARQIIANAKKPSAAPMIDGAAPEVFQATDLAVWDGKPTFGAIWISVAGATQPERVEIRNEETGEIIKASMLADDRPASVDAPIRLSSGAAKALGVAPLVPIRITVTALRKGPVHEEAALVLPASDAPVLAQNNASVLTDIEPFAPAPIASDTPPSLDPAPFEAGFIEVAQAYDPTDAARVVQGLQSQSIPVEVQEDFLRGENLYRVFASSEADANTLFAALDGIRYAAGEEGSDAGSLIAELPNFLAEDSTDVPDWVEVGIFTSRNEAMSIVQKLSRTQVPTEVCDQRQGLLTTFRVFAGPADTDIGLVDPNFRKKLSEAFCLGVAATDASRPISQPQLASAPALDLPTVTPPVPANIPEGAVRIKVGESTGDLNIRVPNPYSEPVQIPVLDLLVSVPTHATPEQVDAIRRALSTIQ